MHENFCNMKKSVIILSGGMDSVTLLHDKKNEIAGIEDLTKYID